MITVERQVISFVGADYPSDELLQASRRLDWRFLLADPELGEVALVGPRRGSLCASLQTFSRSLTVLSSFVELDRVAGSQFDLVVVTGPSGACLEQVSRLIKPGGTIYIEAYGILSLARRKNHLENGWWNEGGRLHTPAALLDALQRSGLVECQVHWHWPDFETCTRMIPLNREGALLYALRPGRNRIMAFWKRIFARWFMPKGLLYFFVPCFSILVQSEIDSLTMENGQLHMRSVPRGIG